MPQLQLQPHFLNNQTTIPFPQWQPTCISTLSGTNASAPFKQHCRVVKKIPQCDSDLTNSAFSSIEGCLCLEVFSSEQRVTEGGKWFLTASHSCPPGLSLQVHTHKAHLHGHSQRVFPFTMHIVTLPGNVGNTLNWSLPFTLQRSVQVCGHHMALLPSFPGSEPCGTLLTQHVFVWHFVPQCSFVTFCSPGYIFHSILYHIAPQSIFHSILLLSYL